MDGQKKARRFRHFTKLIDDGAQAVEEMRSLGYEFGLETEPQTKVSRFLDRLNDLVALLTSNGCSESAKQVDATDDVFGRLVSQFRADTKFAEDVHQRLSQAVQSPDSLLELYRNYTAQFGEEASALEGGVADCREELGRLRQDVEFDNDQAE